MKRNQAMSPPAAGERIALRLQQWERFVVLLRRERNLNEELRKLLVSAEPLMPDELKDEAA